MQYILKQQIPFSLCIYRQLRQRNICKEMNEIRDDANCAYFSHGVMHSNSPKHKYINGAKTLCVYYFSPFEGKLPQPDCCVCVLF